ncbi:ATP synthase subunit I [Teredinibacter waterburyi]|uniref:ATP synthase subunit I n=1 Tax=Teredinibacter waterburyi TaxID=1500538 RepID=UPI001FE9587B|nr:ATP synthase subunit I [Teredinibacter waterburyi]
MDQQTKAMKSPALASIAVQLVVVVPVALVLLVVDMLFAYSFSLGAIVYILPNAYFTLYAFRYTGARSSYWVVKSLKWGESGKFALVCLGFALVFRFVQPLHTPLFFTGFCSMLMLQWWLASFVTSKWLTSLRHRR